MRTSLFSGVVILVALRAAVAGPVPLVHPGSASPASPGGPRAAPASAGSAAAAAFGEAAAAQAAYDTVEGEFTHKVREFFKLLQATKGKQGGGDDLRSKIPKPYSSGTRLLEIARKYPRTPAAVDALVWIVSHCVGSPGEAITTEATRILLTDHAHDPRLVGVCRSLERTEGPASEKLFRALMANPQRSVAGQARLSLARWLRELPRRDAMFGPRPKHPDTARTVVPERESEQLLEEVADKFGDVRIDEESLGESASMELFELRNLAIGKQAPDIVGQDAWRETFRLSESRGKVVVLLFWGNW